MKGGSATSDNKGNLVQSLGLSIDREKFLTVKEVISAYGPPSNLVFYECFGPGCRIHLLYLSHGLLLAIDLSPNHRRGNLYSVKIDPDSKVSFIRFFPPGLEGYISSQHPAYSPDLLINWNGYSTYTYDFSAH